MSLDNIKDFLENAPYLTTKELSDKYQISEETARELRDRGVKDLNFPESTCELYDQYARIRSDKCLIISDVECPEEHSQTLEMALSISKKFSLDTMIINGDLITLDSFSTWVRSSVYKLTFKDELKSALRLLETFSKHFSRIFINCGNHERRLAKKLAGEISIGDFFLAVPGIKFSEYSFSHLISNNVKFLVAHQDNYGRKPLTVAADLCAKYNMSIICGHQHHLGISKDRSGRHWIIDGGSARDSVRTLYKASKINTYPEWHLGFVMVLDGCPFLIDRHNFPFYMNGIIQ